MRISDWSSDVALPICRSSRPRRPASTATASANIVRTAASSPAKSRRNTADRKSVVQGKSVSVRVDLGGRRIITKQHMKISSIATTATKQEQHGAHSARYHHSTNLVTNHTSNKQ